MYKFSGFFVCIVSALTFVSFNTTNKLAQKTAYADQNKDVYIGGIPAGFTLNAGGVQVVGICEVIGECEKKSPASEAGIKVGDKILKIAGIEIETISDLNTILEKNGAKQLKIQVKRGNIEEDFEVMPIKDKNSGKFKIGVLVKDTLSGIGTVTYIEKESKRFGSLGHSVGTEVKECTNTVNGNMYGCSIVNILKGSRGKAGELHGMFLGSQIIGKTDTICDCGIYGEFNSEFDLSKLISATACSSSVAPGDAIIYSTINGQNPEKFTVEIVKVDKNNKENKNYVVKITDKDLIERTGGIVQGMSGSPILQNGVLVGAITHVFLNDPTRGYGIAIEKMLKN